MLGVWHLGGDGNWPGVIGCAGICDGLLCQQQPSPSPATPV